VLCKIDRADREGFEVPVPQQPGRYVVSVLNISDDGDVGAATLAFEVK
jgi:methionine-rich copper-binding protein CopC